MNANLILKGRSFDAFVKSVLRQIAFSQKQDIFFESNLPADLLVIQTGDKELFDAIFVHTTMCYLQCGNLLEGLSENPFLKI